MNNLLGYNVTYYVKNEGKNDESVILAMPIQNQNNDLTISSELFSKLTTKNGNTALNISKMKTLQRQIPLKFHQTPHLFITVSIRLWTKT